MKKIVMKMKMITGTGNQNIKKEINIIKNKKIIGVVKAVVI